MKTGASAGPTVATNKAAGAAGPGVGPGGGPGQDKLGVGGRIVRALAGVVALYIGSVLVLGGYIEGPQRVEGAIPGTFAVERCTTEADDDVVCIGTFRSEDGEHRYLVDDFEPGEEYDSGDEVDAMASSSTSIQPSAGVLYAEGATWWCFAAMVFGGALHLLTSAFRRYKNRPSRFRFYTLLVLFLGGLLGCGISAITAEVLA